MKQEQEIPKPEFNFDADPFEVARNIIGARLNWGSSTAIVVSAQGFERTENERGSYKVLLDKEPGVIVGIPHRKAILPLIVTRNGSCILIRALNVEQPIEGINEIAHETRDRPGKVSEELGLGKNDIRRVVVENPIEKVLRLT